MLTPHRFALCLLAGLAAAGLYASERWAPFIVVSGSMADTLFGPHRQLTCQECGHRYACGADLPVMREKRSICPNCGAAGSPLERAAVCPGQRLAVDMHAFIERSPRRWELAVFSPSGERHASCIKRIVGLPGERIEVRGGDVYADGVIQRKALATQRTMAVLVYDDRCRPAGLPRRWRPDVARSGWSARGSAYYYTPADGSPEQDWLTYHHARRRPGEPAAIDECPIIDSLGYNQGGPVLVSHAVHDVMLSARFTASAASKIDWFITDGRSRFTVSHDIGKQRLVVSQDDKQLATAFANVAASGEAEPAVDAVVELSLCDQQLSFALNGEVMIEVPYTRGNAPYQPTAAPLAVSVSGGAATISDLRVWRDVYYAGNARGGSSPAEAKSLGLDEYYALGDNVAISRDSRSWPNAALRHDRLIGAPAFR